MNRQIRINGIIGMDGIMDMSGTVDMNGYLDRNRNMDRNENKINVSDGKKKERHGITALRLVASLNYRAPRGIG